MKTVSTALSTLLNSAGGGSPLIMFDLYTFTLSSGQKLYYTTADFTITASAPTIWNAPTTDGTSTLWTAGISWAPFAIDDPSSMATGHWKIGLDSDTWQVTFMPRPVDVVTGASFPDKIGSVPWLQAARSGMLDDADVIISRAYFSAMPTHPIALAGLDPVGAITIFRGLVGEIDVTNAAAILTLNDYKSVLTQQLPRNLYQAGCRYRVFDTRCTLSAASYTGSGAAGSASTRGVISAAVGAPAGSATYTLGRLTMTSGNNAGFGRLVSSWSPGAGTFTLLNPFPFDVAAGDTFTVTAGCDHTQATCTAFGNLTNYGGQPYIPIPEITLG